MRKEDILKLEKGYEIDELVSKLIIEPKDVKTKFYAMDSKGEGCYISFDFKSEANQWVEAIKKSCPEHPYLTENGFIKEENIYPRYSEDLEKAFLMEQKLKDLNLENKYIEILRHITGIPSDNTLIGWKMVHASALERCKAGLLTVIENSYSNN